MAMTERERLHLEVTGLSSEGTGIARTEGGVVFVAGALPGEAVVAEVISRHKDFSLARTLSVERAAEGRVVPHCAYCNASGGGCGGCKLQHADYPLQVRLKAGLVRDAMTRIGGFAPELFEGLECMPSPQPWGYRNKAAFPVQSIRGRTTAGFYRAGSHRLVPIRSCPVNAPILNALYRGLLPGLADLPFDGYDERSHTGKLRHILLRVGTRTKETLLSFVINGKLSAQALKALVALGNRGQPTTLTLNHNSRPGNVILGARTERLLGAGLIVEMLEDWTFNIDTTSFFQVNTPQAEQLFAYASAQAEGEILELYSGVGALTCYLARRGNVVSVEEWHKASEMAEANLLCNGLEARTLCGRAEDVMEELPGPYGTVVMDPPRDGCAPGVLEGICRLGIPKVVYVSCNPATLARDCRILAGRGYRLVSIRAFDMFPQTAHVETVVLMSRIEK